MASIEAVKAALIQAAGQGEATLGQIRSAIDNTEQMIARINAVTAGTGHPKITESIARLERSKQHLTEAAASLQIGRQAAREYVSLLG